MSGQPCKKGEITMSIRQFFHIPHESDNLANMARNLIDEGRKQHDLQTVSRLLNVLREIKTIAKEVKGL